MKLAEKAVIAQIRRMAKTTAPAIRTGIGDDCAVLQLPRQRKSPGRSPGKSPDRSPDRSIDTLITTDFSLEGIHFRRHWHSPESIGHRCLARGLSDIAAMGGKPVAAFLSLALPKDVPPSWITRFTRSLLKLAKRYDVTLAGGDTAESPTGILADITVVGTVPTGNAVLRSSARPGDAIYVSGELGGSADTISEMRRKPNRKLNPRQYPRHFFPEPRVELGRILREKNLASAMIDTSDGLSTDLAHICEESGVGAELQAELIPRARIGKPSRQVDLELALHGGEDYELLFTAPANKRIPARIAGVSIAQIGHITRDKRILLTNKDGVSHKLKPLGWEHFRK
jgi:thiamine-monophosphate kinase